MIGYTIIGQGSEQMNAPLFSRIESLIYEDDLINQRKENQGQMSPILTPEHILIVIRL